MDATNGGRGKLEHLESPRIPEGSESPASSGGTGAGGAVEVPSTAPANGPAIRASDRERDAVLQRIQQAFAEGRLDDTEFDDRMRAALTARTHADLDVLLTGPALSWARDRPDDT